MADQVDWPDIYIDASAGSGGVGSEADPYDSFSDINWTTGGDNSVYDWYDGTPTASVTINLKKGEQWREAFTFGADGTATYPIVLQAYGTGADPIISGSLLVTPGSSWSTTGGNVWTATVINRPDQVFMDGNFGDRKSVVGNLADEYDWFWESNVLSIYSTTDPDTAYTSPGVETTRLTRVVSTVTDYVVIDGIHVRHANRTAIGANPPGSFVTVKNCLAEWNFVAGIYTEATPPNEYEGWIIEDCISRYNSTGGIGFAGICQNNIIRRCESYENAYHRSEINHGGFGWGIKIWELLGRIEGCNIYENHVHDNGELGLPTPQAGDGTGIWSDTPQATSWNRNSIHHNYVHDHPGYGVFLEISSNTDVYCNVLVDNGDTDWGYPAGVCIDARQDNISTSEHNRIYNNTIVGGYYGINLHTYSAGVDTSLSYNLIKNNIVIGYATSALYCAGGGDNTGSYGTGNVYDNNCFGAESTDFIHWGSSDHDTYDAWETDHGEAWTQIESDPDLFDTDNDKYWLATGSPCIGAGVEL